ncbi:MAG: DUF2431 domain-containing protein [Verrucomicrobia bacterium]|nr:DUF2431 domain-containing protein [Verrucomicrobiota bacterium]
MTQGIIPAPPAAAGVVHPHEKKACKSRLIVGDGNFTYTLSLIHKHADKNLAPAITATEYKKISELDPETVKTLTILQKKGVHLIFGIDATKLHETFLKGQFRRIHWNCPHPGNTNYESGILKRLVAEFFASASKIQNNGDKIHITLAQPKGQEDFRQIIAYGLLDAAGKAGYVIYDKRKFNQKRYPEYVHTKTVESASCAAAERSVEFIGTKIHDHFEEWAWELGHLNSEERGFYKSKTLESWKATKWKEKYGEKEAVSSDNTTWYLGDDSGDEASSSYEDSDTEKEIKLIEGKVQEIEISDKNKGELPSNTK